nr:MAG TPA: hypothetical protein [Caudoviricetes sp.]
MSRFTIPLLLIDKLWVLVDVAYNFIVSIRIHRLIALSIHNKIL